MIWDQFVSAFGGETKGGGGDRDSTDELNRPRNCTHDPTLIKEPAGEESVVVVEEVGLSVSDAFIGRETYNEGHAGSLDSGGDDDEYGEDFPAGLASLFSSGEQYDKGSDGHAFNDDGKGHEESDRPPHAAEVAFVSSTIGVGGEWRAMGGTSSVEAEGDTDLRSMVLSSEYVKRRQRGHTVMVWRDIH